MLGVTFSVVKTLVVRLNAGSASFEAELLSAGAEVALGAAVAIAVDANLWNAALVVPVLLLIERLYGRMIALRREVASALETFANLVDERDPSTLRHSVRVAESVRRLAGARLPPRRRPAPLGGQPHRPRQDRGGRGGAAEARKARCHGMGRRSPRAAPLGAPPASVSLRRATGEGGRVPRERLDGSGYYGARGDAFRLPRTSSIVADGFDG